jgi:hypothetical protein
MESSYFGNRFYVPNSQELRNLVLKEMHNVPYVGHPGYQKTITTVRGQYFWPGMKKDVTDYLSRCMECQKVKVEHIHPTLLSICCIHFPFLNGNGKLLLSIFGGGYLRDFITKFPNN